MNVINGVLVWFLSEVSRPLADRVLIEIAG